MRRTLLLALAGLLALGVTSAFADRAGPVKKGDDATCGDFGTTVHFENTPSDAARKALKEEKLVLVLHVSGNFEDPKFT